MAPSTQALVMIGQTVHGEGFLGFWTPDGKIRTIVLNDFIPLDLTIARGKTWISGQRRDLGGRNWRAAIATLEQGEVRVQYVLANMSAIADLAVGSERMLALGLDESGNSIAALVRRDHEGAGSPRTLNLESVVSEGTPIGVSEFGGELFVATVSNGAGFAGVHLVALDGILKSGYLMPSAGEIVKESGLQAFVLLRKAEVLIAVAVGLVLAGVAALFFLGQGGRYPKVELAEARGDGDGGDRDYLKEAVVRAELERSMLYKRAFILFGIALVLGAAGILAFLWIAGDADDLTVASDATYLYIYTRAFSVLVLLQVMAYYVMRLFGRAIGEYRDYFGIFLQRADLLTLRDLARDESIVETKAMDVFVHSLASHGRVVEKEKDEQFSLSGLSSWIHEATKGGGGGS